ncbi:MAG: PAS domain S-box protein, partial [Spirochaetales bacterium]|nr:PAS domain S-box protein [Spirochaetales bacterium]
KDLEKYNYTVLTVNSGEKAVEILKTNDNIDLILMDIDLGKGIDGTIAAQLILKKKELPIVFLSSHTEPEIVKKTEKITSYGYVVKSSSITVLDASIKMAFKLFKAHDNMNINEEKFSKAFFNHPVAMQILNIKSGQRIDMNEKCIELFGIDKKEFIKGNIYKNNISVDPKARKMILEKLVKKKKITNMPLDIISSTGDIKHLLASGSILNIDDGDLGIFSYIDITDSKKAEIELLKSEEKYRRLIENLSDEYFFYTHDTNGMKSYVSSSVTKMLGFSLEEAMSHYGSNLTDNPANENVTKKTDQAINGFKQEPYLAESYHKDGSKRWLEISETPIFDTNGKVIAIEGIAHNVTKRIKAEDEIKRQLQEKEIILKEVHHRIKNNFNSISSLLSLQSQETTNPD